MAYTISFVHETFMRISRSPVENNFFPTLEVFFNTFSLTPLKIHCLFVPTKSWSPR